MDFVISVCDKARGETCPVYLHKALRVHWGLPDPDQVVGTEEEIKEAFEDIYKAINIRITEMLKLPLDVLSEKGLVAKLNDIGKVENC